MKKVLACLICILCGCGRPTRAPRETHLAPVRPEALPRATLAGVQDGHAPTPADLPSPTLPMTVDGRLALRARLTDGLDVVDTGVLRRQLDLRSLRIGLGKNGKFNVQIALNGDPGDVVFTEVESRPERSVYTAILKQLNLSVKVYCLKQGDDFCDPRQNAVIALRTLDAGVPQEINLVYQAARVKGMLNGYFATDFQSPLEGRLRAVEVIHSRGPRERLVTLELNTSRGALVVENDPAVDSIVWQINAEKTKDPYQRKYSVGPLERPNPWPLATSELSIPIDNAPWPRVWLTLSRGSIDLQVTR